MVRRNLNSIGYEIFLKLIECSPGEQVSIFGLGVYSTQTTTFSQLHDHINAACRFPGETGGTLKSAAAANPG